MTIPSTGEIRFSDLNAELNRGSTFLTRFDYHQVRAIVGRLSGGPIRLSDMRGKTRASGTYSMVAIQWTTSNNVYNGYAIAGSGLPQNGELSPKSFRGVQISNITVVKAISGATGAHVQLTLNRTSQFQDLNKTLAITIGGLRILVDLVWDGLNFNGVRYAVKDGQAIFAQAQITLSQYNTILNAILNKTSSVSVEYF